jgi:hypothetical protein
MNQFLSLLETQISDIDQPLVLIQDFYQHFDYPFTESEKRLTLQDLFERLTAGRIYWGSGIAFALGAHKINLSLQFLEKGTPPPPY